MTATRHYYGATTQATKVFLDAALVPCRDVDPDVFFSSEDNDRAYAKRLCRSCPVLRECAQAALENDERYGVWAGISASRKDTRRALAAVAEHGADALVAHHAKVAR